MRVRHPSGKTRLHQLGPSRTPCPAPIQPCLNVNTTDLRAAGRVGFPLCSAGQRARLSQHTPGVRSWVSSGPVSMRLTDSCPLYTCPQPPRRKGRLPQGKDVSEKLREGKATRGEVTKHPHPQTGDGLKSKQTPNGKLVSSDGVCVWGAATRTPLRVGCPLGQPFQRHHAAPGLRHARSPSPNVSTSRDSA